MESYQKSSRYLKIFENPSSDLMLRIFTDFKKPATRFLIRGTIVNISPKTN